MRKDVVIGVLFLILAALLAGPITSEATVHEVVVRNFEFDPQFISVAEADTVRWVWESGIHTTTSGDVGTCTPDGMWNAPMDMTNDSFEFQFVSAGVFPYYCIPHCLTNMNGSVTVEPPGPTVHEVIVRNFEFAPRFVVIDQGDIVRWVWESGIHTTTSGDPVSCTPDGLWNAPMDMTNDTFEFQFNDTGTFTFFCIPHCLMDMNGSVSVVPVVGIREENAVTGAGLLLRASSPNPTASQTTIPYQVPSDGRVRLTMHDASGRFVTTLVDGVRPAGDHAIKWDGHDARGIEVASGVYFARLEYAGEIQSRRLVLIR